MMDQYFEVSYRIDLEKDFHKYLIKFYRKCPGYLFGIFGVFLGGGSILIAFLLYLSADSSYSISTHYISDLGIGPNGANLCFAIGLPLYGSIIFFYHLYEIHKSSNLKNNKILLIPIWFGLISYSMGGILAGLFPVNLLMHSVAAFLYFMGSIVYYSILIISTLLKNKKSLLFSILCGTILIVYCLFASISIVSQLVPEILNFISITFCEWLTLFFHFPAILIRSLYLLIVRKLAERKKLSDVDLLVILNRGYVPT